MAFLACLPLLASLLLVVAQPDRTVTFVNNCATDVWIWVSAGAAGSCASGCPTGSTCDPIGKTICYYNNPTPELDTYRVTAGKQNSITYPGVPGDTAWNGNYAFCQDGTACTASPSDCDAQGCRSAGPYAESEMNLLYNVVDGYDVSLIQGVNVPYTISPNGMSPDGYTCGTPGSTSAVSGLGPASWSMDPPENIYQWVTPPDPTNPQACTSNGQCPSGQKCGLIVNNDVFSEVCGVLSGYWSENEVCTLDVNTPYFPCTQSVDNGPRFPNTNIAYIQGCDMNHGVTGSCYTPNIDQYCCGCVNWDEIIGSSLVASPTDIGNTCQNNNTNWISDVLDSITWLKEACPTCYSYPYDDPTSSFTCGNLASGYNNVDYTVTLCPSGISIYEGSGSSTSSPPSGGSGSTPPSGGTGTCAGTSYNPSTSVCDNGVICPTGQNACNGVCYDATSQCCTSNTLGPNTAGCDCNGQVYDGTSYLCDNNQLCSTGLYSCGQACYDATAYSCCSGNLMPAGQGC